LRHHDDTEAGGRKGGKARRQSLGDAQDVTHEGPGAAQASQPAGELRHEGRRVALINRDRGACTARLPLAPFTTVATRSRARSDCC
jgi:hypothetical protein